MEPACIQLFVNDVYPDPAGIAIMNALSLTVSSGIRSFAPVLGTSIFAAGIKSGFADGHTIWIGIVFVAITGNIPLYFLPEAAEGKLQKTAQSPRGDDEEQ